MHSYLDSFYIKKKFDKNLELSLEFRIFKYREEGRDEEILKNLKI